MNSSENPKVEEGTLGSSPRATGCSLLWLRDLVKQPPPTEPHTLPKEEFPPSPYIRLAHRWTTRGSRNEKRPGLEELSNSRALCRSWVVVDYVCGCPTGFDDLAAHILHLRDWLTRAGRKRRLRLGRARALGREIRSGCREIITDSARNRAVR